MKYSGLCLLLLLAGCAANREAPPPSMGKANPAAVYCVQIGGNRVPVQSPQGVRSECRLPGGEVIGEWELWRRDHPAKQ